MTFTKSEWISGILGTDKEMRRSILKHRILSMSVIERNMWKLRLSGNMRAFPYLFIDKKHEESVVETMVQIGFKTDHLANIRRLGAIYNFKHITVAGGSVLHALGESDEFSDVDVFIEADDAKDVILQSVLKENCRELPYDYYGPFECVRIQGDGMTTDAIFVDGDATQVTVLFDVDCCGVSWDGVKFFATLRAMNSIQTKVNMFELFLHADAKHITIFSNRLIKYSTRGYTISMPKEYLGPFENVNELFDAIFTRNDNSVSAIPRSSYLKSVYNLF